MNIVEALGGAGGLAQIAKELGVDEQTVQSGAAALMPAMLGGFKQQAAAQPDGIDGLMGMLGGMGGGGLLDQVLSQDATPTEPGNQLLGQLFGGEQGNQAVAQHAAGSTGIDPALIKKLMPILAMAAAGFMAKQAGAGTGGTVAAGGLGGLLSSVVGSMMGGGQASAGGMAGIASMLDIDGDGNPLDDIMGMASKFTR